MEDVELHLLLETFSGIVMSIELMMDWPRLSPLQLHSWCMDRLGGTTNEGIDEDAVWIKLL